MHNKQGTDRRLGDRRSSNNNLEGGGDADKMYTVGQSKFRPRYTLKYIRKMVKIDTHNRPKTWKSAWYTYLMIQINMQFNSKTHQSVSMKTTGPKAKTC